MVLHALILFTPPSPGDRDTTVHAELAESGLRGKRPQRTAEIRVLSAHTWYLLSAHGDIGCRDSHRVISGPRWAGVGAGRSWNSQGGKWREESISQRRERSAVSNAGAKPGRVRPASDFP